MIVDLICSAKKSIESSFPRAFSADAASPLVAESTKTSALAAVIPETETRPCIPYIELPVENITSKGELAFFELTRRVIKGDGVGPEKKVELLKKLEPYKGREGDLAQLSDALKNGDLDHPLFNDLDDMAQLALWGVKDGHIDISFFATLMNVRVAKQHYRGVRHIPLFLNDSINPQAKKYLKEMATFNRSDLSALAKNESDFMSDEEIDLLFAKMKGEDPAQQFILVAEDDRPMKSLSSDISVNMTVSEVFSKGLRMDFFNRIHSERLRVIPSFNLLQTTVEQRATDHRFKINPVLGFSTCAQIAEGAIFSWRDMALPFPGVKLPDKADNFAAPGFDMTYHDFYHALKASSLSHNEQSAFIWFKEVISGLKLTPRSNISDNDLELTRTRIVKAIIDLDVSVQNDSNVMRLASRMGLAEKVRIWCGLDCLLGNAKARLEGLKVRNISMMMHPMLRKFVKELKRIKSSGLDWEKEFQIDIQGLEEIQFLFAKAFVEEAMQLKYPSRFCFLSQLNYDMGTNHFFSLYDMFGEAGLIDNFETSARRLEEGIELMCSFNRADFLEREQAAFKRDPLFFKYLSEKSKDEVLGFR